MDQSTESAYGATKRCYKCGVAKPHDEFYRNRSRLDGRTDECKVCILARHREKYQQSPVFRAQLARRKAAWMQTYPERALEQGRKYRQRNAERLRLQKQQHWARARVFQTQQKRDRYWLDPEANRQKLRERYARNPEEYKARAAQWRQQHPEEVRASRKRYEALKRGASDGTLTAKQWDAIKAIYANRCAYCGALASLTQDHVVPLSKGGAHSAKNVVPVCKSCNSKKHVKPPPTYQPHLGIAEARQGYQS